MFSALPPTMDVGLARLKTLRRLKGSQPDLRDRHSAPPQVFKSAGPGGRLVMSSALRNDILTSSRHSRYQTLPDCRLVRRPPSSYQGSSRVPKTSACCPNS